MCVSVGVCVEGLAEVLASSRRSYFVCFSCSKNNKGIEHLIIALTCTPTIRFNGSSLCLAFYGMWKSCALRESQCASLCVSLCLEGLLPVSSLLKPHSDQEFPISLAGRR